MATYHEQACPLCGEPAEYCYVDARNRKYFKCPKCTYFQISRRAEKLLAEQPQERRDRYASEAPTTPSDQMLVIRMPSAEFRQESNDLLQATLVSKKELQLDCQ